MYWFIGEGWQYTSNGDTINNFLMLHRFTPPDISLVSTIVVKDDTIMGESLQTIEYICSSVLSAYDKDVHEVIWSEHGQFYICWRYLEGGNIFSQLLNFDIIT